MAGDGTHDVYLNLSGMSDSIDGSGLFNVGRIALKCDTISVSTTKNVMAIPLPFSGIVTGEAQTLGMDFGVATKNISVSGILTEQVIQKRFETPPTGTNPAVLTGDSAGIMSITLTAEEIAQLIHSYVDSSFVQTQQNIASLIVLIPSRVNGSYQYHTNAQPGGSLDSPDLLPRIPFTYKTRGGDAATYGPLTVSTGLDAAPLQKGKFPSPITDSEVASLTGFVRSFNTTFMPGQPFIEFSLEFEVAITPG